MSRGLLTLREPTAADVAQLATMWAEELRGTDPEVHRDDVEELVARVTAADDEQILIAETGGELAGVILIRAARVSPLNADLVVQAVAPYVLPEHRRKGVGQALMEAAVAFAEERGIGYVGAASVTKSREANRFMARLGLAPQAMLRIAGTHAVRAKITALSPRPRRGAGTQKSLGQVLAARRSMRRQD